MWALWARVLVLAQLALLLLAKTGTGPDWRMLAEAGSRLLP